MSSSPLQKPRTDWFAWSLHLVCSLLLGGLLGVAVASVFWRKRVSDYTQIGMLILGVSLIMGATTSFKGNRAWFKPSIWDEQDSPRTRLANALSLVLGLLGAMNLTGAIGRFLVEPPPFAFHIRTRAGHVVAIMGLLYVLIQALRARTLFCFGIARFSNDDSPWVFWLLWTLHVLLMSAILHVLFTFDNASTLGVH